MSLEQVQQAVAEYHANWRHPRLSPPEFSGLYALHPEEPTATPNSAAWPETWPFNGRPGVYFAFGAEMQLLYIGKAFNFGSPLSQHFKWSEGGGKGICRAQGTWKTRPMFVVALVVSKQFEAPSLEEYLIEILDPPENFVGRKRMVDALPNPPPF